MAAVVHCYSITHLHVRLLQRRSPAELQPTQQPCLRRQNARRQQAEAAAEQLAALEVAAEEGRWRTCQSSWR